MTTDPTERLIPDADFVAEIDKLLEKHRPSLTVPWSLHEVPAWAQGFRPRRILDIGAGLGAFTSSYIDVLNHWSCLDALSELVLLDGERALFGPTVEEGTALACSRMRDKLGSGAERVRIHYDVRNAEVRDDHVAPLQELGWRPDLIVASHVTYYFGNGLGLDLVSRLAAHHLAPGGRIWLVIRRLNCPIYEVRAKAIRQLGREDPKPFDYAELFLATAASKLPGLEILEHRTMRFRILLPEPRRLRAIHLLMWRAAPDKLNFPLGLKAATEVAKTPAPFHEEHILLGRR